MLCYRRGSRPKGETAFFLAEKLKLNSRSKHSKILAAKFIEKRGEGVHHIAFALIVLRKDWKNEAAGINLIDKPRKCRRT